MKLKFFLLALSVTMQVYAQRNPGSPLDHLPANQELLTHFGERADFSPDNSEIAFMSGSFGHAFVINLKSRQIRCLTCGIPGAAFLRVMHLSTGDYILMGPEKFSDIHISRTRDNELWYLSKKPGSKPIKLGIKMSEGAAISKKTMKISFSELPAQFPEMPAGTSRLVVADLDLSGGSPKLINRKVVYQSKSPSCNLEAQDFYDNDSKLTFTCYDKLNLPKGVDSLASSNGIDLKTGKVTNFSNSPETYNECEGMFSDGRYTCVESDRQVAQLGGFHGTHEIDIYKLKLDGTGKDVTRLTHFNDFEGWKASNPVISTDGKYMAFQIAHTADEAGVGYGLVLYKF